MDAITPYLNFNGDAAEALTLYAAAFEGQIVFSQRYGDGPMETSEDWKNKIMHASFQAGTLSLMVSDVMPGQEVSGGTNTSLSLNFPDVAGIDRVFAALSDGAQITMPLEDTFWGARFGMLTDRFGISWMFNHDYEKKDKS